MHTERKIKVPGWEHERQKNGVRRPREPSSSSISLAFSSSPRFICNLSNAFEAFVGPNTLSACSFSH